VSMPSARQRRRSWPGRDHHRCGRGRARGSDWCGWWPPVSSPGPCRNAPAVDGRGDRLTHPQALPTPERGLQAPRVERGLYGEGDATGKDILAAGSAPARGAAPRGANVCACKGAANVLRPLR
jgi:hypothetical protein